MLTHPAGENWASPHWLAHSPLCVVVVDVVVSSSFKHYISFFLFESGKTWFLALNFPPLPFSDGCIVDVVFSLGEAFYIKPIWDYHTVLCTTLLNAGGKWTLTFWLLNPLGRLPSRCAGWLDVGKSRLPSHDPHKLSAVPFVPGWLC